MDLNEKIDLLKDCELFKDLNRTEIEKIAALGFIEEFSAGENIFNQGDIGENLLVIVEGSVFLERAIDTGSRKGKAAISILGRGRALGCWSTLLGHSHSLMSSAICQQPLKVVVFRGADLRDIMLIDHGLGFKILQALCLLLTDRIQCAYGAMDNI